MRTSIQNLKPDFPDRTDRAVSPVIGVILMVAITVILAAVLGTFVLGIGGDLQETPQASMTITDIDLEDNGNVTIRHQGGAALVGSDVQVVIFAEDEEINRSSLDTWLTDDEDPFQTGQTVDLALGSGDDNIEENDLVEVLLIYDGSGETIASSTHRA